jgi:hypothetical protein
MDAQLAVTAVVILAVYLAYRFGRWMERISSLANLLTRLEQLEQLEQTAEGQQLTVERVNTQYYAYADGQFLAQGKTFQELFEVVKQRFPSSDFRVMPKDSDLSEQEQTQMRAAIYKVFGDSQ